jgi:hypothetical protein
MVKKKLESKTLRTFYGVLILSIITEFIPLFQGYFPHANRFCFGLALAGVILRHLTKEPVEPPVKRPFQLIRRLR